MAKVIQNKARYWVAVLYLENMVEDWEIKIGDLLQLPYAYCIHNKDTDTLSEHRKDHLHLIIAFPNTTTYNNAMTVFNTLSCEDRKALNTCEPVINIRSKYEYLIHNTETCKKQGKYLYDVSERITGNNFDIGAYEQLSITDKLSIKKDIYQIIKDNKIDNMLDLADIIYSLNDTSYQEVFENNNNYFKNLVSGVYHKNYKAILIEREIAEIRKKE